MQQHREAIVAFITENKKATPQEVHNKTSIPYIVIYATVKALQSHGLKVEETKEGKTYSISDAKKLSQELQRLSEGKSIPSTQTRAQEENKAATETTDKPKSSYVVPKFSKPQRDTTRYKFKGEIRGKGPTVLAVIQDYCSQKKNLATIKETFPDSIIGKYGVTNLLAKAKEMEKETGRPRYFTREEQIIQTRDGKKICVSNQVDGKRFDALSAIFKSLGYKITPVEAKTTVEE